MISMVRTGHMYFNSPIETCDKCGNCDGVNCDNCEEVFEVENRPGRFPSLELAKIAEDAIKTLLGSIDGRPLTYYNALFIRDDVLYAKVWGGLDSGYTNVKCSKDSILYDDLLAETKTNHERWNECKCTDKATALCETSCDVFKCCNDCRCFNEMKNRGRTERKCYL